MALIGNVVIRKPFLIFTGEGMGGIWLQGTNTESPSKLTVNGQQEDLAELASPRRRIQKSSLFYIPAQRVLSLANGWPRPFTGFGSEDPFTVRDLSETFRILMEQEFGRTDVLFPKTNRLKREYRDLLSKHVFGGFGLRVDRHGAQKRLVLQQREKSKSIPYMAWSAGQREFVPLLMGLYWLMPGAKVKLRKDVERVVIEEPEMGLHPDAISVVLLLVLELLWRGYKICLSTHSPHILDVVWAMRVIADRQADFTKLLEVFEVRKSDSMKRVAESVGQKTTKVYYFTPDGNTKDISNLNPSSTEWGEAGWGGLTEFSGRVNKIVATVVNDSSKDNN
ncbi:MAG: AAA family ATPase [bacterium]